MSVWFWVVAVIVVVIVALFGVRNFSASRHWEATEGTVLSSSAETIRKPGSTSEGQFDYMIQLSYEYFVGQQKFTGNVWAAGLPNVVSSKHDADDILKEYEQGKRVTVYYDPNAPEKAALVTAKSVPIGGVVAIFTFVLLVGAGIVWVLKSGVLSD